MTHVKVKDAPGFVKDVETAAVLNTDNSALQAYKMKRQKERVVVDAVADINNMKQDINELKTLMQRILDKIG